MVLCKRLFSKAFETLENVNVPVKKKISPVNVNDLKRKETDSNIDSIIDSTKRMKIKSKKDEEIDDLHKTIKVLRKELNKTLTKKNELQHLCIGMYNQIQAKDEEIKELDYLLQQTQAVDQASKYVVV